MKKILLLILAAVVLFCSCQKKDITSLTLALTQEKIDLPASSDATDPLHCYISVFSNTNWECSLDCEGQWCHLDRNNGSGTQYIKMEYEKNNTSQERYAQFVIWAGADTCRIQITQPK